MDALHLRAHIKLAEDPNFASSIRTMCLTITCNHSIQDPTSFSSLHGSLLSHTHRYTQMHNKNIKN